ncbi:NINE protein [Pleurocapsales cyanobacterium LEGE 06147]|nr:NINE protein [Pleurocapsales cyanobacterium LEGE 06147]
MSALEKLFGQPKNRRVAVILALLGTITPLAGLHKFYLGQPLWGIIYLLLWSTPMPRIASAIDAVWYLVQESEQFQLQFQGFGKTIQSTGIELQQVSAIADALRELDRLREDGLVSEYEFEQKRRQLLDRIA